MEFVRKTHQGAYVFSEWLHCPEVGQYVKEVQIFADNKREAKAMAKDMFKEIDAQDKTPAKRKQ